MAWVLSAFADEAGKNLEEQIKALRRAGLKHVDLRGVDEFNIAMLPLDRAREARKQLDAVGVRVAMFGSPLGKIDIEDDIAGDLEKLRRLGELKDVLGCNRARIFSYFNKAKRPKDEWRETSLLRLSWLRDEARRLGLALYHENERHIFGDEAEDCLTLAKELRDGQTFFTIFDSANFIAGGQDVARAWELLSPYTDAFHLKDMTGAKRHVPLGQGAGRYREILAESLRRDWQGPLTVEPHLAHSDAVMATGPSGTANEEYSKMPLADSFHVAAEAAKGVLKEIGAAWV
ncbi:MAG: sugar phosphate isomerase/epimerase [Candidatus Sumerlaeota bacterium]|nr:sugar phosphate isomerase/epimerase [Candidatus Sumerlaeota bacterium]